MRFLPLIFLLISSVLFTHPAQADTERKVLKGNTDPVVETYKHECVRTKWKSANDPCAPPPPPPPAPVVMEAPPPPPPPPPQPRTIIAQDDRTVYFDFNETVLKPEAKQKLHLLAGVLKDAKDIQRAEIVGFADPMGSKKYNYALSEKRAKVVNDYVRSQGYLKTVVAKVRGVGEDQAKASCGGKMQRDTRIKCLSPDRKVEVEIVYSVVEMPGSAVK